MMISSALEVSRKDYNTCQTQTCHKAESYPQQYHWQSAGSQLAGIEVERTKTHSRLGKPGGVFHSAELLE